MLCKGLPATWLCPASQMDPKTWNPQGHQENTAHRINGPGFTGAHRDQGAWRNLT